MPRYSIGVERSTRSSEEYTVSQTLMETRESVPIGTPRWVKAFGIIALLLILLVAAMHLTGNGLGGHRSHLPSTGNREHDSHQP